VGLVTRNHVRRGGGGRTWGVQREEEWGRGSEVHTCDRIKLHLQRTLVASLFPFLGEGLWRGRSYKREKSERVQTHTQTKGVWWGVTRTELFKSVEKHAGNANEGECAEEDLEVVAGLAGGCAWAVRAKGYVVCCLGGEIRGFSVCSGRGQDKGRDNVRGEGHVLKTTHSTTTFQHSNKQAKQNPTNQLFSHQATVPSNPSSAEPQAAHEQPPSPRSTAWPTAPRRSTEGWARSSRLTPSSLLVRVRRWPLPDTCETDVVVAVVGEGGRRCGALPGGWLAFFYSN
jgi:hypothetical protein